MNPVDGMAEVYGQLSPEEHARMHAQLHARIVRLEEALRELTDALKKKGVGEELNPLPRHI